MKERPILFSGPMVRALLAGTKTQTRRICKYGVAHNGVWADVAYPARDGMPIFWWKIQGELKNKAELTREQYAEGCPCPYGTPGDRLWVRETWRQTDLGVEYRANTSTDGPVDGSADAESVRWKPSIHMPRTLSRISLEISDVRGERLSDLTEEDARAEGVSVTPGHLSRPIGSKEPPTPYTHRQAFAALWDQINGPRGYDWASNPWVWVLTLRKVPA